MKFNQDKCIFKFSVDRKVEKEVSEITKDDNGDDIVTKKLAKIKEPVSVIVLKPSRYMKEEAELFHGKTFNKLLNDGFLTRHMMIKKMGDNGGVWSKQDYEEYDTLVKTMTNARYEMERYISLEEDEKSSPVELEKFQESKETLAVVTDKIAEYKRNIESAFAHSADSVAEQRLLDWFVVNLAYYTTDSMAGKGEQTEIFPLFRGETYEQKREDFLNKDDEDWTPTSEREKLEKEVFSLAGAKLIQAISVWYYNYASNQQDIELILKNIEKDEKATSVNE